MDSGTFKRRHPSLLSSNGKPFLPGGVVHDRRRHEAVEELIEAMRARARASRSEPGKPPAARRWAHQTFWLALAVLALTALIITLIARSANNSIALKDQPLGAGAVYGWLGFHREACILTVAR